MAFTRTFQDKPFYNVSEVSAITGLSRRVVEVNFTLVKAPGFDQKKIAKEEIEKYLENNR